MRSVMHPMQNTTELSYKLSYQSQQLPKYGTLSQFSSNRVHRLTQAGVIQLPGSSDVSNWGVSVSSSISDNCRNFQKFTRLVKFIHKSQNEECELKICCQKRMQRLSYSEQCILKYEYFLSPKDLYFSDYFEALSVFSTYTCTDFLPQKSEKLLHQVMAP